MVAREVGEVPRSAAAPCRSLPNIATICSATKPGMPSPIMAWHAASPGISTNSILLEVAADSSAATSA
jgi:hypothetical protein